MGGSPQKAAQPVIIMYPLYLDLRNSAFLFLKLMRMKERRQDQDLADIKVGKKDAEQPQFLQAVHTGKAII